MCMGSHRESFTRRSAVIVWWPVFLPHCATDVDAGWQTGGYMANCIGAQTSTCLVCHPMYEQLVEDLEVTMLPRGNTPDILLSV